MKRTFLAIAAALMLAGSVFAQGEPGGPRGPMGPGFGGMPGFEWKLGTSVTTEYKKLTGQVVIGQKLDATFKAEGVEYILRLPPKAASLLDVKNGDTVTFEGLATTIKTADTKVPAMFRPFKATVNGKDIDLKPMRGDDRGNAPPPAQNQ